MSDPGRFSPPRDPAARLMRLVDEAADQTAALRKRISSIEVSLELLSRELRAATDAPMPLAPQPPVAEAFPAAVADEDEARLMAIELAVSGSSRGEVAQRLARDHRTVDATAILDDVFGQGSADGSRMPWNS